MLFRSRRRSRSVGVGHLEGVYGHHARADGVGGGVDVDDDGERVRVMAELGREKTGVTGLYQAYCD